MCTGRTPPALHQLGEKTRLECIKAWSIISPQLSISLTLLLRRLPVSSRSEELLLNCRALLPPPPPITIPLVLFPQLFWVFTSSEGRLENRTLVHLGEKAAVRRSRCHSTWEVCWSVSLKQKYLWRKNKPFTACIWSLHLHLQKNQSKGWKMWTLNVFVVYLS